FSSRRRHTRFSRDWSSDVCSSDLVDVPLRSTSDLIGQVLVRQGVIEVAGHPVEDVAVGVLAAELLDHVGVPGRDQGVDGVFVVVGVEVADDELVRVPAAGRVVGEVVDDRLGGLRASDAALALAVSGVRAVVARRALGLEVVDRDGEDLTGGELPERLGEHRPVLRVVEPRVDRGVEHGRVPDRLDDPRLVQYADANGIRTEHAGVDVVVGSRPFGLVETGDEVGSGLHAGGVLHLHEPDDVRVQSGDTAQDGSALALELLGAVGAAALHRSVGAAGVLALVEGEEVVEHVEARHLHGPADRGCGLRPRVRRLVAAVLGGLDAVGPVRVVDDADDAGHGVAATEAVRRRERLAVPRVRQRLGILPRGGVVEGDGVPVVLRLQLPRLIPGLGDGGRGVQAVASLQRLAQDDLAEAVVVVVLADHQGVGELDEHALHGLEIARVLHREAHRRRCDGLSGTKHLDGGIGELGLGGLDAVLRGLVLPDRPGDPDLLTRIHAVGGAVDEDPFGGRGVIVGVRRLLLQVEAPEVRLDGRDDRLDRLLAGAGVVVGLAAALDVRDEHDVGAGLTAVARRLRISASCVVTLARPEGGRRRPRPGPVEALQRLTDRGTAALDDADVGARQPVGRSADGGELPFVGQELDDLTGLVDQGEPVGRAVLDAGLLDDHDAGFVHRAEVRRGVGRPAVAVVEDDRPAGQIGARRGLDLDRFAGVAPGVVVVQLADDDVTVGGDAGRGNREQRCEREGADRCGGHPRSVVTDTGAAHATTSWTSGVGVPVITTAGTDTRNRYGYRFTQRSSVGDPDARQASHVSRRPRTVATRAVPARSVAGLGPESARTGGMTPSLVPFHNQKDMTCR